MQQTIKKSTSYLLSFVMIMALLAGVYLPVSAKSSSGDTIVAFTSDVHNEPANEAADRLGNWIDAVNTYVGGKIDHMAFCGDMGKSSGEPGSGSGSYWDWTKKVMDVMTTKGIEATYTTGNHECNSNDGGYNASTNYGADTTQGKFKVNKLAKTDEKYEIYCLGSVSQNQEYKSDQITALQTYLNSIPSGSTKLYFIATHYPLHSVSSRSTTNASGVISAINSAVADRKITVFVVWGHNHTVPDTANYGKIYTPGSASSLLGASNQFYYLSAGCMSDSENSTGNAASITAKGLMVRIAATGKSFSLSFFDKNGSMIGSESSYSIGGSEPTTKSYTVSFNANGHGNAPSAQTVAEGAKVNKPSDPTSSGWSFGGWYTEQSCQNAYNFNSAVTKSFTLYAKWTEVSKPTYTVSFNANGHGTAPSAQTVTEGNKASKPTDPSAQGWTFGGWYTEQSCQNAYNFNNAVTKSFTLYAKWTETQKQTYTVSFNANGHGNAPSAQTVTEGGKVNKPSDPSSSGWTFGGWYTEQSCQNAYNFNNAVTKSFTLYAKWTEAPKPTYTVSFNANGHGNAPSAQTVTEGNKASKPTDPSAQGWTFGGWYTEQSCQNAYNFNNAVTKSFTLYAKWTEAPKPTYTVSFNANGHGNAPSAQTVTEGNKASKPTDPSAQGWTFGGWYTEQSCQNAYNFNNAVTKSFTLYAKWTETPKPTYTVSFNANGHGNAPSSQTVTEGEKVKKPSDPTSAGWTFGGWYTEQSCQNAYNFNNAVTRSFTLYAKWTEVPKPTYTVSFNANGHGTAPDPQIIIEGGKVQEPASLTEDGWIFDGWYTEQNCQNAYNFNNAVTKSFSLYAKWTKDSEEEQRRREEEQRQKEEEQRRQEEEQRQKEEEQRRQEEEQRRQEQQRQQIKKIQTTKLKLKSVKVGIKKATVKWNVNKIYDGYEISYKKKGGKWKTVRISSNKVKSKVIKKLKKGGKYSFRIRGYKKYLGKILYGIYSKTITKNIK